MPNFKRVPARCYPRNIVGNLAQVTDASGMRTLVYDIYGEPESDTFSSGGKTHIVTETRDAPGRSAGYGYVKDGLQQTATIGYGEDG